MSKPQLVLVPGAWHAPFYMATMTSKLEALGYKVHARQMPGVGSSNPSKDLSEDVAALRSTVEEAIGNGNDVIVICHSWGGMVTGSGLVGLSKQEREAQGKKGGVVRTGYMTAFIVPEGVTLMNAVGDVPPAWFDIQEPYVYATDPAAFYNDLPLSEQQDWHSKLQSQTYVTFNVGATAATWKQIPTSYLLCEDDIAIPWQGQQAMCDAVKEAGGEIEVTRIKAGHSPFLSKVDETVEWIEGIVKKV